MKVDDIPVVLDEDAASEGVNEFRQAAPGYLQELIEQVHGIEGLDSLDQLHEEDMKALAGGSMSADYAVRARGKWVVVKFRSQGAEAEAEALRAWKKAGADVVAVYNDGVIPSTKEKEHPVKFLVLEAAQDEKNELAPTAQDYLKDHPEEAKAIGQVMGRVLAAMHRAQDGSNYGNFADMWGSEENPPQSWNAYLIGYVDEHRQDLLDLGFTELKLKNLKRVLEKMGFPKNGVYLHGDFSTRNAMLVDHSPQTGNRSFQVKIIDPNPLIGQPSWDLAVLRNNLEFARRKVLHRPDNPDFQKELSVQRDIYDGVMEGYRESGGPDIDLQALDAAMLMQTLYLLPGKERKTEGENLEALVVKDTLFDKLEALAY